MFQRVRLQHNLKFKGWNSQAPGEFPAEFDSSNVSRRNVSRRIGRTVDFLDFPQMSDIVFDLHALFKRFLAFAKKTSRRNIKTCQDDRLWSFNHVRKHWKSA